jgi:hypothetical protein
MAMVAERLTRALQQAGIPVDGVSIGRPDDKSTWRVDYAPAATAQHRVDGDALKSSFNPDDPAVVTSEKAAQAASADTDLLLQAVAQVDFEERQKLTVKAGQTLLTAAQCKARIRAVYQSLL